VADLFKVSAAPFGGMGTDAFSRSPRRTPLNAISSAESMGTESMGTGINGDGRISLAGFGFNADCRHYHALPCTVLTATMKIRDGGNHEAANNSGN
jgi:hypothetical protein